MNRAFNERTWLGLLVRLRFLIITDYGIHDAMTLRTIRERVWSEGPSAVYFLAKPFDPLGDLMPLIQKALSEPGPITSWRAYLRRRRAPAR